MTFLPESSPFKRQPYKMVKHTHRPLPTDCLSVFDHFVGLAPKRIKSTLYKCMLYLFYVTRDNNIDTSIWILYTNNLNFHITSPMNFNLLIK